MSQWAWAQAGNAEQPVSASGIRGALPATLSKSLDSKKLKDGDPVVAQTTVPVQAQDGTVLPAGSKILGHVTQAQARSKGDAQSSLAITFDKVESKKGQAIPINGKLQALAPGVPSYGGPGSPPGFPGPNTGPAGGGAPTLGSGYPQGGTLGGHPIGSGTTAPTPAGQTPDDTNNPNPGANRSVLNSESKGAIGFHNLDMDANSVLTTTGKELKLDSGTQMIIRAE